ncbi:MAG: carotenoid oxygenase family protein [Gloeomargaritaceae cyanobacterium C42_A2020_066]|nr:carotenoid oxygenase family protein [Gloeomargaritaceae cyanobacterium C42_A2020_066]
MTTLTPQPTRSYSLSDWQGGHRSQTEELAYWIDDIEGQVPLELAGTLFRNGPGRLDINGQRFHHPFDGDGMINSFVFRQGRVFYRNRFVRTAGYQAEQAAGRILYRGVFGTQKPGGLLANCLDLRLKNIANTQVIYWGDKLLALWEAAEPHRLDPYTLETLGLDTLEGLLAPGDAFAAHPRIDPAGRLVNFAVKPGPVTTLSLYEFDPAGRLVSQQARQIQGFAFLHDFALTPHYAIFFQNPMRFNPLPYLLGLAGAAQCLQFLADQPTKIVVIPRDPGRPVQTLLGPSCFVFHHANAYELGDSLVVDSICYDHFPSLPPQGDYRQVDFSQLPAGQLRRFTLNLPSAQVETETLLSRCCEFPQVHPDVVGRPYAQVYLAVAHEPQGNAPLQAIAAMDVTTGAEQVWSAAPRGFVSEPVYVPHPDSQNETGGWLLSVVYDAERQASDLVILDAAHVSHGPLARLKLRHHIPYGLHGTFTPHDFGPQ